VMVIMYSAPTRPSSVTATTIDVMLFGAEKTHALSRHKLV